MSGVHRRDQGEVGRVGDRSLGPGDGDLPILKGLAQRLQGSNVELGEFVEEEHTVVAQDVQNTLESIGGKVEEAKPPVQRASSPMPGTATREVHPGRSARQGRLAGQPSSTSDLIVSGRSG